jgi:predicted metal-binding membrane protein
MNSFADRALGTDPPALRVGLIAALSAAAWAALAIWSASPYARYLDHGGWGEPAWLRELCRGLPAGLALAAVLWAVGWLLMIAAMMLPTTVPLLRIFSRMTASRPDATGLLLRVVLGYAVAWLGFGLLAYFLDSMLHLAAAKSVWLVGRGELVGAWVLVAAGAFQFSSLKYRCLERCRTPFAFINARWHGRGPSREAFGIGLAHGAFCVGCCWALMLVMFVVGMGNLGWMLVVAAVMAAEKNLPWGRRLSAPLGLGLIAWGGALVAVTI